MKPRRGRLAGTPQVRPWLQSFPDARARRREAAFAVLQQEFMYGEDEYWFQVPWRRQRAVLEHPTTDDWPLDLKDVPVLDNIFQVGCAILPWMFFVWIHPSLLGPTSQCHVCYPSLGPPSSL
eukprot:PhM_4_TR18616/c0_g1_i1/m.83736